MVTTEPRATGVLSVLQALVADMKYSGFGLDGRAQGTDEYFDIKYLSRGGIAPQT